MENKHLLIIEDLVEEARFAEQLAASRGIETRVASDFKSALTEINSSRPAAIASDLFFPSGDIAQAPYLQQVLPVYEAHLKKFRQKTEGPLVEVLKQIFPDRGSLTKEQFFEEITKLFLADSTEVEIEATRDAYFGIENYARYAKLQKHIEEMKQGRNIPYGVFIVEEARKLKIPIHIVTSTNHHDIAFEPIRDRIGVYSDDLRNGHKSWTAAFNYLLKELKGGN